MNKNTVPLSRQLLSLLLTIAMVLSLCAPAAAVGLESVNILEMEPITQEVPVEDPETEVPETEVPETEVPETEVPETEIPETEVPEAEASVSLESAALESAALETGTVSFGGGSGTKEDPYLISSSTHLENLRNASVTCNQENFAANQYYKQTANVWLSGSGIYNFTGNYDGDGYNIALNIDDCAQYPGHKDKIRGCGLFGFLNNKAVVKNLTLSGTVTSADADKTDFILTGALAGRALGATIYNVGSTANVTGSSKGTHSYVGGLVGYMIYGAKLANSWSAGMVQTGGSVGGLVGVSESESRVDNCWYGGVVSGGVNDNYALVGNNLYGGIIICGYATFDTAQFLYDFESTGIVYGCDFRTAAAMQSTFMNTLNSNVVGSAGRIGIDASELWYWSMFNSAFNGYPIPRKSAIQGEGTESNPYLISSNGELAVLRDVSTAGNASFCSGKYFKQTADLSLSGQGLSYFAGTYDGDGYSINLSIDTAQKNGGVFGEFGLFGYLQPKSVVKKLNLTGSVTATNLNGATYLHAGALAGRVDGATIYDVASTAAVTGLKENTFIGGLVGYASNIKLANSCSTGTVKIGGNIGGILGQLADATGTVVANCWFGGAVSGGTNIGALVGKLVAGAVSNSYAQIGSANILVGSGSGSGCGFMEDVTTKKVKDTLNANKSAAATSIDVATTELWDWNDFDSYPVVSDSLPEAKGNASDPYIISSLADLQALRTASVDDGTAGFRAGKYYKQTADITEAFTGGGIPYFSGTYDGNGYSINLSIDTPQTETHSYFGLFGRLGEGAVVKNLNLTGSVNGAVSEGQNRRYIGAIAGDAQTGKIYNVNSSVNVTGLRDGAYYTLVGGLVGESGGLQVANCCSTGTVTTGGNIGGLMGNMAGGTMSNCWYGGTVSNGQYWLGALVGAITAGACTKSYAKTGSASALFGSGLGTDCNFIEVTDVINFNDQRSRDSRLAPTDTLNLGRFDVADSIGVARTELWYWNMCIGGSYPILSKKPFSGEGTKETPYFINSAVDLIILQELSAANVEFTKGKHFRQTRAIEEEEVSTPEDQNLFVIPEFYGIYDGGGFILYIGDILSRVEDNRGVDVYIGLFGKLGTGAVVKNLQLWGNLYHQKQEPGNPSFNYYMGALAGWAGQATVYNVWSDACMYGASLEMESTRYMGGFVGYADGLKMANCANIGLMGDARVTGVRGGLIGYMTGGAQMANCFYAAWITPYGAMGNGKDVGALVGHCENGTAIKCYASQESADKLGIEGGIWRSRIEMGTSEMQLELDGNRKAAAAAIGCDTADLWYWYRLYSHSPELCSIHFDNSIEPKSLEGGTTISWDLVKTYGSKEIPFIIDDEGDLEDLRALSIQDGTRHFAYGKYFKQTADLTLNGDSGIYGFAGTYDGDGHTITLNITKTHGTTEGYAGLFGDLSGGATIKNLNLNGTVNITTKPTNGKVNYVGALAGRAMVDKDSTAKITVQNINNAVNVTNTSGTSESHTDLLIGSGLEGVENSINTGVLIIGSSTATISDLSITNGAYYNAASLANVSATVTVGSGRTADGAMYSLQNSGGKYYNGSKWITGETWLKVGGGTATKPSLDLSKILTADGRYTIGMYGAEASYAGKPAAANIKTVTFTLDNTAPVVASASETTGVRPTGTITLTLTEVNPKTSESISGATLTPTDGGAAGSLGTVQYSSSGTITAELSGLSLGKSYTLTIPAAQIQDRAGNTAVKDYVRTFTVVNSIDSGAEQGPADITVQWADTFGLVLTLQHNNTSITWPADTENYKRCGEVTHTDIGDGKTQYTATYRMLVSSGGPFTLTATQGMDMDANPPLNGFTFNYTVKPTIRSSNDSSDGTPDMMENSSLMEESNLIIEDREYDGTTNIVVSVRDRTIYGKYFEDDDTVLVGEFAGSVTNPNAGENKVVTITQGTMRFQGKYADCYGFGDFPTDRTVTISPKTIDLSNVNFDQDSVETTKEYDGTANGAVADFYRIQFATGVGTERLQVSQPSGIYATQTVDYTDDANVGKNHTYKLSMNNLEIGDTIYGRPNPNYSVTMCDTLPFSNGVITPKPITIRPENENAGSDPYVIAVNTPKSISDLTGAWTAPDALTTLIPGTDFTVTYSLKDDQDVASLSDNDTKISATGTAENIIVTATIALKDTVAANNYQLSSSTQELHFKATGVPIPFDVPDVQTKTYGDGNFSVAATTGAPADALDQYNYESSNTEVATVDADGDVTIVGVGNTTITITAKAKTGAYAYGTVPYMDNSKTVTITVDKADLTDALKGLSFTKEYDKTNALTNATPTNATIMGAKGEQFTVSAVNGVYQTSANADTANVADAAKVKITGLTLTNGTGAAANYKIGDKSFTSGAGVTGLNITTTAKSSITTKSIDVSTATISGITATKEYDGAMTNATVTMTGATIATGVNGEVLTLTGPTTVNYTDNANVASNHTYQILATSLGIEDKGGALAGNYTLTGTKTFINGVITKKTITIEPTNTDSYTIIQNQAAVAISSLTGVWNMNDAIAGHVPTFAVTYSLTNGKNVASLSESNTKIAATGAATGITVTATIALTGSEAGNYALTEGTKVLYIDAINGVQIPFNVTQIHNVTYGAEPITILTDLGQKEASWSHTPLEAFKETTYKIGSNSDGAISLNSNTVTILKAGTATVIVTAKAKTGADTVYAYGAVPYVDNSKTVTITVNKADLTDVLKTLSFTKEYDRSANFTNATPTNATITGVKSETFTVSNVSGAYNSAGVDAATVNITDLTLTDGTGAAANYKIGDKTFTSGTGVAGLNITTTAPSTISKKAISLTTSLTKVYDGATTAALGEVGTQTFTTDPVMSGDTITITDVSGAYSSEKVHTAASNSAITFTTSGAENYTITWTVTDEVTHKSGVTVTAKTGDIKIEAAALTTALTSVDSYVNVTGLISDETVANNLYGALTWDDESKSYKSGDGNMSVAFYKLKAGVTSNGGTAGTWADFNKNAETPAENMGDVLELISATTAPAAGTYYVLINAPTGVVGNYNVTGFADKNSALLASFNKLTVSNPPSGGGGSGSSSSASETETKTEVLPTAENDVKAEATVKGETASLKISTAEVEKASGNLTFDLSALSQSVTAAALPVDTLAKLAGKVDAVTIALTETAVTLDAAVLDTVANAGSGDVTLSVAEHDKTPLDAGAQIMIGDQPVYELSLKVGEKDIHELGGKATISLPYTLKASEKPELMAVWRMVDGVPQPLECWYDAATGKVIFESETFSLYVVAYFPFADVPTSSWYYAPAAYAYMTGLMNGMGDYQFQPDFKLSRPMLATMLYGMEGKPAVSMSNPFSDLLDYVWYKTPVLWAAEQKLINGYYSNVFGVDDAVTREQMALILYNYATQKGYDVSGSTDLSIFTDSQNITGWAQDAIRWAVANGLLSGRGDGTLDPKGQISRAEVAAIMYAFAQKFVY